MPKVEIDETDLVSFQKLNEFVQKGLGNPKTRKLLLQAQKENFPNTPVPELDAAEPVMAAVTKLTEDFNALRTDMTKAQEERAEKDRQKAVDARWNETRQTALKAGYTGEGLTKLEEFMATEGIANHAHAIPAFERLNPPPPTVTPNGRFDVFASRSPADVDLKPLFETGGADESWLQSTVADTLRQLRTAA